MALDLRLQAPKVIAPEVDKNKLLLLGLNLLNKGLSLPCAIVQPQAKTNVKASTTVVKVDMKPSGTSPSSSPPMPAVLANTVPVTAVTVEGSRKRKRDPNTDINEPERREKRKMMNRVSAQNARDRKKAYVEDLEKKIALLEEKNKKLEEENSVLKKHTSSLAQEKEQLAEKLDHQADDLKALVKETLIQEPFWLGSAVPRLVSLQQKRFLKQLFLVRVILAFSLNLWPTSLELPIQQQQLEELQVQEVTALSNLSPLLRESPWWGASQSKWNPPMN